MLALQSIRVSIWVPNTSPQFLGTLQNIDLEVVYFQLIYTTCFILTKLYTWLKTPVRFCETHPCSKII